MVDETFFRILRIRKQKQKTDMELTTENIITLVDETKDLSRKEQIKVAYSLPMTAGCLYCIQMKKRHNIDVPQ